MTAITENIIKENEIKDSVTGLADDTEQENGHENNQDNSHDNEEEQLLLGLLPYGN